MLYVSIIIFSALLYTYYHFRDRVPILMYHRIASVPGDRNALPGEKFEEQMRYLEENGFHSITVEELQAHFLHGKRLPKKPVVLTFDDGYEDNFSAALPILKKYRHVGNVFPIANWIGRENKWENFGKAPTRTMNESELALWRDEGHYVGSHTMDHPFLSRCGTDRLHDELSGSKRFFENLNGKPVECLCYPYGDFDRKVMQEAEKCGYKLGLAIFYDVPLWTQDLLALPRIPIPARQPMWEFKLKVSRIHLIFIWLRQLERRFKKTFRK